ncbi:MAG: hypothetical protein IJ493_07395 [Clostridia bacterium]|nr:hypothetical protein [Clostridia bacterium]
MTDFWITGWQKLISGSQRIAFSEGLKKKVHTFPTNFIVDDEELRITFFDGEATLMMLDEAQEIFGDKLK